VNEKFKLMLVDDDVMCLESLERALKRQGYDCVTFSDPEKALLAFDKSEYQVVLTDFRMPKINGLELIRRLRTLAPEIKAIIFTGYYQEKYNELSRKSNISAYLSKPIQIAALIEELNEMKETILKVTKSKRKYIEKKSEENTCTVKTYSW